MLKKHISNALLLLSLLLSGFVFAQSTDRIIVKFKHGATSMLRANINSDKMAIMQQSMGAPLQFKRQMFDGASVFQLDKETDINTVKAYAKKLMQQKNIDYAEPDYRKYPASFTTEPRYNDQWYLHDADSINRSALNLASAWQIEDGSSNPVTVAILDSGYLPNTPDLNNQYVAGTPLSGYDFISEDALGVYVSANDGSGRDNNPEDAGDGYTVAEYQAEVQRSASSASVNLLDCNGVISSNVNHSWHGTFVAGIVAAEANNNDMVGINPNARILMLRVLGRCGGYTSDIADAIRWAAGLSVSGVGANTNVAKIINLSLGSTNACSQTEQSAISDAFNAGSVIIVAAGNEATAVSSSAPANCQNVMTVGAVTQGGAETDYTNTGEAVDISAPGGSGGVSSQILSLSNDGLQSRGNAVLKSEVGTSFSTPMVSGVASLMLAKNPNLTPSQIMGTLKATATTFPTNTSDGYRDCVSSNCGEGILNAYAALVAVRDGNIKTDFDTSNSADVYTAVGSSIGSVNKNLILFLTMFLLFTKSIKKGQFRRPLGIRKMVRKDE